MMRLRVASWPGYGATHNPFIHVFLKGLEDAGCEVVSLETVEACAGQAPDILLLHWAERVFGESRNRWQALVKIRNLLTSLAARPAQTRVVWLVHNIAPHDARRLQRLVWPYYTRALARQVDGFMTLSPGTVDQVRTALPVLAARPAVGLWHPDYPGAVLPYDERTSARAALGWTDAQHVLGYCGQIRPYKGVEELLVTFRKTTGSDLRLLLAGRPVTAGFADWLRSVAADDPRIVLRLADLPPAAFRAALGSCNTVVAPFRDYLHSGSIVHALSAARPVLTPATPFARSLQGRLGADWVRTHDGPLTPALLESQVGFSAGLGRPNLSDMAAKKVGREAARFFHDLMQTG
jgi:glycosyltransferase involved in cell wall biosynthesis